MRSSSTELPPRGLTGVDIKRALIVLVALLLVLGSYWIALPSAQKLFLPKAPGGEAGPWVVRPIMAFRFGAAGILSAVTAPYVLGPIKKSWRKHDEEAGTRYDPYAGRPLARARFWLSGGVLLLVYATFLVAYLLFWVRVGPDGIDTHLPWGAKPGPYREITSLEYIPEGMRSESITQNGPWYSVTFQGGRSVQFSLDNEGLSPEELDALTRYIDEKSWVQWRVRGDARRRD